MIVIPKRGTPPPSKTNTEPKKPFVFDPTRIRSNPTPDASSFAPKSLLEQAGESLGLSKPPSVVLPQWDPRYTSMYVDLDKLLESYPLPPLPTGEPFILHSWQATDIRKMVEYERVGAFIPVGGGKTVMATLCALAWDDAIRVVVVLPILVRQWVIWLNSIDPAGCAIAYKGSVAQRKAMDLASSRWWVMSYGVFKNDFERLTKESRGRKHTLIVDEAHCLKNPRTANFKKCEQFSAGQKMIMMTGTELNNPADAYAYCRLKTPGLYSSYGQFERIHVGKRDFFDKPMEWVNLEFLNENLYLQSVKRTKEEIHAHLPKANYIPLVYDLDPGHYKLYLELVEKQILELEDGGKIDATTANSLYVHAQQIVINWQHYAGEKEVRPACFDLLDDLADQIGLGTPGGPNKFIVWTWFTKSTETVRDYLREKYGDQRVATAYGKSNSAKEVERFMEDPECWWLGANPLSAGAGLNPQYVCYNSLFLEVPTRTIPFRQAAGRIDREGQTKNANIWIAQAFNTIQEQLYQNLLTNDALVQKVQGGAADLRRIIRGG